MIIYMFQCHSPKLFLSDLKPKETKDLYTENYKTLVKEIKEELIEGEIHHVHGLEESI